jgi:hypothetical protein
MDINSTVNSLHEDIDMASPIAQQAGQQGFFVNNEDVWFFLAANPFGLAILSQDEAEKRFVALMKSCDFEMDGDLADCMKEYAYYVDADNIYDSRGFGTPYSSAEDILNYEV